MGTPTLNRTLTRTHKSLLKPKREETFGCPDSELTKIKVNRCHED